MPSPVHRDKINTLKDAYLGVSFIKTMQNRAKKTRIRVRTVSYTHLDGQTHRDLVVYQLGGAVGGIAAAAFGCLSKIWRTCAHRIVCDAASDAVGHRKEYV